MQLPYWIDGSHRITETKAILKHIARTRKPELLGSTLKESSETEMTEEYVWDMWTSLTRICLHNTVCTITFNSTQYLHIYGVSQSEYNNYSLFLNLPYEHND